MSRQIEHHFASSFAYTILPQYRKRRVCVT